MRQKEPLVGFKQNAIATIKINKIKDGPTNSLDMIQSGDVQLIINTASKIAMEDQRKMRLAALKRNIPVITTVPGALATSSAIEVYNMNSLSVKPFKLLSSRT